MRQTIKPFWLSHQERYYSPLATFRIVIVQFLVRFIWVFSHANFGHPLLQYGLNQPKLPWTNHKSRSITPFGDLYNIINSITCFGRRSLAISVFSPYAVNIKDAYFILHRHSLGPNKPVLVWLFRIMVTLGAIQKPKDAICVVWFNTKYSYRDYTVIISEGRTFQPSTITNRLYIGEQLSA